MNNGCWLAKSISITFLVIFLLHVAISVELSFLLEIYRITTCWTIVASNPVSEWVCIKNLTPEFVW